MAGRRRDTGDEYGEEPKRPAVGDREKIIARLKAISKNESGAVRFTSARGIEGKIELHGLAGPENRFVPYYGDDRHPGMSLEHLQEIVRVNESFIAWPPPSRVFRPPVTETLVP
jgi:hypothetical protein